MLHTTCRNSNKSTESSYPFKPPDIQKVTAILNKAKTPPVAPPPKRPSRSKLY